MCYNGTFESDTNGTFIPLLTSDKLEWVKHNLGEEFKKRLILSHHKDLCKGDFIIDDRPYHGVASFDGVWIQFGSEKFPDWDSVRVYITAWKDFYDRIRDKDNIFPNAKETIPIEMQAFYIGEIDNIQLEWLKGVREELEKEWLPEYPNAVENEMRAAVAYVGNPPRTTVMEMAEWLIDPRPTDML